jgi:hypothetical protein
VRHTSDLEIQFMQMKNKDQRLEQVHSVFLTENMTNRIKVCVLEGHILKSKDC